MAIDYVAYDKRGDRVSGTLETDSREKAQEVLWGNNLIILSLKKQRRLPALAELFPSVFRVKPLDIINFTRELASLLGSGIPLRSALRVLYDLTGKQAFKKVIRLVVQDIEAGLPFSLALSKHPSVFPPFYIHLIKIAEETGDLKETLLEITKHMEKQRTLIGKVRKALTYPIIVLTVGLAGGFILLRFAVPAITKLLEEYKAEMSLPTRMMINLGNFTEHYGTFVLFSIILLAVLVWLYVRTRQGRKKWDRFILKVPLLGRIIEQSQMARLCSNLATLIGTGLPTAEALRLSVGTSDSTFFQDGLSEVYREVSAGSRLEPAISAQKKFPRLFCQTVGIAEESGSLKTSLRGLADFYELETDKAASRFTETIEPTLIIVVGLAIGFSGAAIMSAIYGIIPQIK